MKLLCSELHKIWGQRIFALCLAVLVATNLFLLYIGTKPGEYSPDAAAYREVAEDLQGLSTQEQQALIYEKQNLVYGVLQIEQLLAYSADGGYAGVNLRQEYADLFDQYEEVYRSKAYDLYTKDLRTEYALLSQIKAELDTVASYPEFLQEVQVKANQLSGISIFQSSASSYNQRNIDKTSKVYANMQDVEIEYAPQKGLFTALDYQFTDLILLAAMLLTASLLVRQERDSGMLNVIRSTPGGRLKTAAAKLTALALTLLIVIALMVGVNLLYCGLTFGLGPLSRSIQSVPALMRCTMQITVWQYLARFLLAKWAGAFVMGLWVLLAMLWARRTVTGWVAALALPVLQWGIRAVIPATSHWNVLKYANLSSLMRTNELLGNYRNLYWFDYPLGLPLVEWAAAIGYGLLFAGGFCWLFCRGQLRPAPVFAGFAHKAVRTKATTVLGQECRKQFLACGAAVVLVLFVGYQTWNVLKAENYIDANGIYYAHYMKQLEGPYTRQTVRDLREMEQEFEPIYELQRQYSSGKINRQTYESRIGAYYGLVEKMNVFNSIVRDQLGYLQEHPGAQLIYECGWEKLLGFSGNADLQEALWAGLLSSICFSGLFAFEKKGGMQRVVMATPLGRRRTLHAKLFAGSMAAAMITALTCLPRVAVILRDYGLSEWFAPAMSIWDYSKVPAWIPLAGIVLWAVLGRFAACLAMMLYLFWLSDRLGNALAALFVGTITLCLAPMLALSGFTALTWVGAYPLFHLAEMVRRPLDSLAGAFCLVLAFGLCWLLKEDLCRRWASSRS